MKLKPSTRVPERQLLYGAWGSGKTNAWFSIANHTEGNFYVVDTDLAVPEFLTGERYGHLEDRIEWQSPEDMAEAIEFLEWAVDKATPLEDWIVVDRIDWAWEAAQEEFTDRIFGKDIDEHFMAFRKSWEQQKDKSGGAGNPFEGFTDWPTIKKRHARFMKLLMKATKKGVHWVVTAGEKEVDSKLDSQQIQREFGKIGFRPAGEKTNSHIPRTVIRMQGNRPETWRVTTAKDREREQLEGQGVGDFAIDYLLSVAGWE